MGKLVFALLDTSHRFANRKTAERARELSIGFTRFKYSGPIIEGADPNRLLAQAADSGYRCCVLQPYGSFLQEVWVPEDREHFGLMDALARWAESNDALAAGGFADGRPREDHLEHLFLLVDLEQYRQEGRPSYDAICLRAPETPLPEIIARNVVRLHFDENEPWMVATRRLSENLQRAVFVWNIEPYDDIEAPPDAFMPPLNALYTAAAGFKPNRILHTHGATPETRMLVFDYSKKGLEYRRLLHGEWDGVDYPSFLRRLLQRLPPSEAHYLLWQGADPDSLDWSLLEARWQQELDAWGGAEILREHWRMFRRMELEYVYCDLLKQPQRLLDRISDEPGSLIWWSNAFLTIHSIWHYPAARRQEIYRAWIHRLSEKAPKLRLIGADCNNLSINGITAGEYADWLDREPSDPLDILQPRVPGRFEMRF